MFNPDYKNIIDCAYNRKPNRIPLYEHIIDPKILEAVTGRKILHNCSVNWTGYFKEFCAALVELGYDTISYEGCVTEVLPYGGALAHPGQGYIDSPEKFEKYPFDSVKDLFIKAFTGRFDALRKSLPKGMKAVGGAGNGIFEIAQDLCGFEGLCLLKYDEPDLFSKLFVRIGDMLLEIWEWVLNEYSDVFCVARFGDDLGYKSGTMLPPEDIRVEIIPQYKRIISFIHSCKIPFLLHSCGKIFDVMDDIIEISHINAKHSNEDQIASMSEWVSRYGKKIGNFGGIDTDHLVRMSDEPLVKTVNDLYKLAESKKGGFAIGSGNSIPEYVNPQKYKLMIDTVRKLRGDT